LRDWRSSIDRIVLCKLPYVSRIGRSYEAIACTSCSAGAIRNRRDGWIRLGVFARPQHGALESCDHTISVVLDRIAVDSSITRHPAAARSPDCPRSTREPPIFRRRTPSSGRSEVGMYRCAAPSRGPVPASTRVREWPGVHPALPRA
jgi:hypothetical protein